MIGNSTPLPGVLGPATLTDNAVVFWEDFLNVGIGTTTGADFASTADVAPWLFTLTNSASPALVDDVNGGVIRLGVTGTNNDKVNLQMNGSGFTTQTGKRLLFETRVRTSAIAGTVMMAGLAVKNSTTLATNTTFATTPTDFVGFKVSATSGALICVCKGASTESTATPSNSAALANDTWTRLAFEIVSTDRVNYFVDGVKVASLTSTIPLTSVGLTPGIEGKAQASTAFNLDIDYVKVVTER